MRFLALSVALCAFVPSFTVALPPNTSVFSPATSFKGSYSDAPIRLNSPPVTPERTAGDQSPATNSGSFRASASCPAAQATITIRVYFRSTFYLPPDQRLLRGNGYISPELFQKALDRLNKNFANNNSGTKYKFVLATGKTESNAGVWYYSFLDKGQWDNFVVPYPTDQSRLDVLSATADQIRGTVNKRPSNQNQQLYFYVNNKISDGVRSFAFLPSSTAFSADGVWASQQYFETYSTNVNNYYPSDITQSVGAWANLLFISTGGCSAPNTALGGDLVADTPKFDYTEDFFSNSCPGVPGYDYKKLVSPCNQAQPFVAKNIRNFMSLTSLPICPTEFTAGQFERISTSLQSVRGLFPHVPSRQRSE